MDMMWVIKKEKHMSRENTGTSSRVLAEASGWVETLSKDEEPG